MSLYENIHQWGRTCLQCGSFRVRDSLFCQSCEEKMLASVMSKPLSWLGRSGLVPGFAYLTWIPNQNRPLSLLIESLKGGRLKKAWLFWSRQIITQLPAEFSTQVSSQNLKPVIVPAPSSRPKMKDHAAVFAESLAELTGWELKNCLHKESGQSQKRLGKIERQLIELSSDENFSDDRVVLFVDDVVTTGATAKAAHLALGKPKKFFVLAFASREE